MTVLYRTEELRRLEERTQAALAPGTLMQRAGQSAANWIHAWLASTAPATPGTPGLATQILILCGPGNNGGDGYACASALRRLGHACLCWAPRTGSRSDALAARERWEHEGGSVVTALPEARAVGIVVDALFGIGGERPLEEPYLGALRWVQAQGLPLLALDLPSGLDANTGNWIGGVAGAPAHRTITFLGDKPGLHTADGIDAAGALALAPLGVDDPHPEARGRLNAPAMFPALLRTRAANSNKGDFGALAIIGGAAGMVGAALLAGRAALRLGAGKVYVFGLGAATLAVDPVQPELMLRSMAQLGEPGAAIDVLVAGCGLGTDGAALACVQQALEHAGPLVLDADALNLLAAQPPLQGRLAARAAGTTILTPHPGEAARLLGLPTRALQLDRVGHALRLAERWGAIVVLKGAGSVIGLPQALGGAYVINPTGNAALASAGTGDVLAGMIGALLGQVARTESAAAEGGRPSAAPPVPHAVLQAVLGAVWLHGQAANDFGATIGLTASDVAPLAARALARLRAGG